jgi:hypothetical protein
MDHEKLDDLVKSTLDDLVFGGTDPSRLGVNI